MGVTSGIPLIFVRALPAMCYGNAGLVFSSHTPHPKQPEKSLVAQRSGILLKIVSMRSFTVLFLLLFSLFACREQTTSERTSRLTGEFYVRYLQPEGQYKAEAMLWEETNEGEIVPLTIDGPLTFLDHPLQPSSENTAPILRFQTTFNQPYQTNQKFQLTLANRGPKTISLQLVSPGSPQVSATHPKNAPLAIDLAGSGLEENESLVLLFTDNRRETQVVTIAGPRKQTPLQVDPAELANLAPGTIELYLVKKQVRPIESSWHQINCILEYYTESVFFQLTP